MPPDAHCTLIKFGGDLFIIGMPHGLGMGRTYAANGKTVAGWCDRCGTLILGESCSCGSKVRRFEINSPGDIRPAMGDAGRLVRSLFEEAFGTSAPLDKKAVFLNKVPGEDRTDEIVAHGVVIGILRFDVETRRHMLEIRQAGAELFDQCASSNVVSFSGMSGHLKGKSIPGENIRDIVGTFGPGAPLILRKGNKVGAGIALAHSSSLKEQEKAVRIRDLADPIGMPLSPDSGRKRFVEANRRHLAHLESIGAEEIRGALRGRRSVTASFSGGKDSLAALGILLNVVKDPQLLFVDTGLEFPETLEYVERFASDRHLKLLKAEAGDAFRRNVDAFGPPAKDFRWCCKVCKLGPVTDLISEHFPKGTVTVEGNRMLESFSRSRTPAVSKNPFVPNQTTLNPVRTWTAAEVWGYIWMKGLEYNPLYDRDFERIGCYLCASCLSSEWENTRRIHPEMHSDWDAYLRGYAKERGLPDEYVDMGFWRWKVLPPKMVAIAERLDLDLRPKAIAGPSMKVLKGASSCAAGGFSAEAVVTLPRARGFSAVEDSLHPIGDVRYSDEFEIAVVRNDDGTAKLFGGGQVSVVSKTQEGASRLFERSVKALLRSQMCTSCGICVKRCPKGAITIKDGVHIDGRLCTSCGLCEGSCMVAHYYDKLL